MGNVLWWTPTHGHTSIGWPVKTYIHQLCVEKEYRLEKLPWLIGMDKRESREYVLLVHLYDNGDLLISIIWNPNLFQELDSLNFFIYIYIYICYDNPHFCILINSVRKHAKVSLSLRVFWTIVFIFIVISTTFRPICPPAFFRCLSNSGTFTELQTTSFIESTGVACSDSVNHNQVQVLSIPVLLLTCNQDWTCILQMIVSLEA